MTQRQFRLNSPSTVHQLALNQRSLLFFVSHLGPYVVKFAFIYPLFCLIYFALHYSPKDTLKINLYPSMPNSSICLSFVAC